MADDVIILKTSGIPLFSRCYGGETCKLHPDHALQSGFLAALYSFAKESFSQSGIKSVLFHDLKLDFKVDEDKEIIIVFVNPIKEDSNKITKQLEETYKLFIEKYSNKIDSIFVDTSTFVEFDKDLLNLDIVPRESVGEVKLHKHPFWEKVYKRLKRKKKR
ncbi:MAG TPA: hypothetical protein VMX55_15580 [candidate division Zixibacteria bacterium]|nr:hypothetical protein [candidate division Zixibacteria bacterium]